MLHCIYGRAGYGKTQYVYETMERLLQRRANMFLIVPEQQAVVTERDIVQRMGNRSNLYIEVVNFKRLCNRVFRECGGIAVPRLGKAGRKLVMSLVLDELGPFLSEYAPSARNIDFTKKALSQLDEMTAFHISPDALDETAGRVADDDGTGSLHNKLSDLSLISRAFDAHLRGRFSEQGDPLDRLCEVLATTPFFKGRTVFVDSFYGFTPQEIVVLEQIIKSAEDTYVTFLWDRYAENQELFERGHAARDALYRAAARHNIAIDETVLTANRRHGPSSALYEFERRFGLSSISGARRERSGRSLVSVSDRDQSPAPQPEGSEPSQHPGGRLKVMACEDVFEEALCACSLIERLVRQGAHYRDIAVVARDLSRYDGIMDAAMAECGIPFFYEKQENLAAKPLPTLVLSAFEICEGWHKDAVLRLIKTGLSGLTDTEADLLENYAGTWRLWGRRFCEGEWLMNPDGYTDVWTAQGQEVLKIVTHARDKLIKQIGTFCDQVDAARNVRELSYAVYHLVESAQAMSAAEDDVHDSNTEREALQGWAFRGLLYDALDQLVLVMGDHEVTPRQYAELIRLTLEDFSVGKIPASLDEVQFAELSLMRTGGLQYLILLGANDGVFPQCEPAAGLFTGQERALLDRYGLTLAKDGAERIYDEFFLAYHTLCSAEQEAFVLYAKKSAGLDELQPSILITMIDNLLPGRCRTEFHMDRPVELDADAMPSGTDLDSCARLYETLTAKEHLLDSLAAERNPAVLEAKERFLLQDRQYAEQTKQFLKKAADSYYLDSKAADFLYSGDLVASASRLDRFNLCPFSHFARYVLKLEAAPTAELGPAETGNIAHRVLELYGRDLAAKSKNNEPLDTPDEAKERILTLLSSYLHTIAGKNAEIALTRRFLYLYQRLSGLLAAIAVGFAEELSQSEFVPVGFELPISPFPVPGYEDESVVESIGVPLPGGKMLYLAGKVDRVDLYEKGGKTYLRIIDYKTGTKKFHLEDIAAGFDLQMLLYLQTLCSNGTKWGTQGNEVIPAGVLYIPVRKPETAASLGTPAQEIQDGAEKTYTANGVLIDDIEVLRAMEKDLTGKYIPVRLKKDGAFTQASNVVTLAEMGHAMRSAGSAAAQLAKEISRGNKRRYPYRCAKVDACSYCDYRPVCRFEAGKDEARYTIRPLHSADERPGHRPADRPEGEEL